MFIIDNTTIKISRGDEALMGIIAYKEDESKYIFQVGEKIRFAIYEKNNYEKKAFEKIIEVDEEADEIKMKLTSQEMKIGDIINKPKNYWYEIELIRGEEHQTIMGYDENGAKIFRLYPEGDENL